MTRAVVAGGIGGALLAALLVGPIAVSRADRIVLRGGGEIRGVVLPDREHPEQVSVQTETGVKPLIFPKPKVVQVIPEPGPLDDYLARRDSIAAKAGDQYEFGLWCEGRKLTGPAEIHYRRAVELDKDFAPAHKKLGHVYLSGRWMTQDEAKAAQGLVKYKGKWISQQEMARISGKAALSAEQRSWMRRLNILRQEILFGADEKRQKAEAQVVAIREPSAVWPLIQVFGGDPAQVRLLMDDALAGISGPESTAGIVACLLAEADPSLRGRLLDELNHRRGPKLRDRLLQALRSDDMLVVGRAAWALAGLNEIAAVPKLIPVLVRVEDEIVFTPSTPGASPGNISVGSVTPVAPMAARTPYGNLPNVYQSLPILTGPAVAPGAIAFGATTLPVPGGMTTTTMGSNNQPKTTIVSTLYRNPPVLEALVKLTGQDFGYDIDSWRLWLRSGPRRPEPKPAERRVPQP